MKFDLVSDLHLDVMKVKEKDPYTYLEEIFSEPQSNTLLIAGDIADCLAEEQRITNHLYQLVTRKYDQVFTVLGNHDYMSRKIPLEETLTQVRKRYLKIKWLENEIIQIENCLLFGATFWTSIAEKNVAFLADYMPDYRFIRKADDKPLRPMDTNYINLKSRLQLQRIIEKNFEKPLIVLTHHAPILSSSPCPEGPSTQGFCNDLRTFLLNHPNIKIWCHGHVHNQVDLNLYGTKIVCNPHGYLGSERLREEKYKPITVEVK